MRTGCKVKHPSRKYKRKSELYRRRMFCGVAGAEIARACKMRAVDYFRMEQQGGPNSYRAMCTYIKKGQWSSIAQRLADYWHCEPEDIFPEEAEEQERKQRRKASIPGVAESLLSSHTHRMSQDPSDLYDHTELRDAFEQLPLDELYELRFLFSRSCGKLSPSLNITAEGIRMRKYRWQCRLLTAKWLEVFDGFLGHSRESLAALKAVLRERLT